MKTLFTTLLAALLCTGCSSLNNYVISGTSTVIGVEIGQNPQTQMYQAKLGYVRAELALVPTNKDGTNTFARGAADTANVIMEIKYNGIFSSNSGIYQRLAVGDVAVAQPGAAFMFAKSSDGNLDPLTATAVSEAIKGITNAPSSSVVASVMPLARLYEQAADKTKFDQAAQQQGWGNFGQFLIDKNLTLQKIQGMYELLKAMKVL